MASIEHGRPLRVKSREKVGETLRKTAAPVSAAKSSRSTWVDFLFHRPRFLFHFLSFCLSFFFDFLFVSLSFLPVAEFFIRRSGHRNVDKRHSNMFLSSLFLTLNYCQPQEINTKSSARDGS